MSYLPKLSHNLKQGANRYGAPLMLSAPQKDESIWSKVRFKAENI